ncbi:helix-turn-helix domain-containing protein [Ferdinandcohnia quinoae]|uniref:AraC family transcriptional regulator n=1 Tax=Fredinandcohnia quinoae TaxID=2918902 RepID=A0AAW5E3J2_9BACI|nr:AraC family transcriptional regulator [Fredinandcohnia sp. SECRCQ15]MCH1627497.1 AraC family transcriptional regulator [Fredinandcohnia sp. SECRCQ15]
MNYTVNQIIDYFAKSSFEYVNIITNQILPQQRDGNRTTAYGVSGIVIPLSGKANFSFNETTYKMQENMIVHAGSQMNLEIETIGDKPWEYVVIHYKTLHNAPFNLKNKDFSINIKQMVKIKDFVYQLIKFSSEPGSFATFQVKVIFLNLVKEILEQAKKHVEEKNSSIIPKAIAFIQENYAKDFSIGELAERLRIERRRFSELFEQHIGLSPIQYLTEYRIHNARELLRLGHYSIAEVAEMTGYQDSFYFSRVFKKHVGMSPSKYRKYIEENSIFINQ